MNTDISDAETRCRAAWAAAPEAQFAWCCHHEVELEALKQSAENRIAYIMAKKPEEERVVRLDNFRPVLSPIPAEWDKARAELAKAYAEWDKACAEWDKAYAELDKAYAELAKACAEWDKTEAHKADVPHHTWNGKNIF